MNKAATNLVELEFQSVASTAQSGPSGSAAVPGQIVRSATTINSDAVTRIHANFLDDDASGTLIDACVVALDRNRAAGATDAQAAKLISDARNEVIKNKAVADDKEQAAKNAAERLKNVPMVQGADAAARATERQKAEEAAASANEDLGRAERKLGYLENILTKPSLGNLCAAMLKNGPPEQNFLLQLQDHKLKARTAESSVALKQTLVTGCAESTKDIPDKTGRADKYAACVSRALTLAR